EGAGRVADARATATAFGAASAATRSLEGCAPIPWINNCGRLLSEITSSGSSSGGVGSDFGGSGGGSGGTGDGGGGDSKEVGRVAQDGNTGDTAAGGVASSIGGGSGGAGAGAGGGGTPSVDGKGSNLPVQVPDKDDTT
ncbi:unnamed protein product, partial [Scytosiphon promiscuus]